MVKLWENDISREPMPLIGDVGSGLKKMKTMTKPYISQILYLELFTHQCLEINFSQLCFYLPKALISCQWKGKNTQNYHCSFVKLN